jgi:hypothetical protein
VTSLDGHQNNLTGQLQQQATTISRLKKQSKTSRDPDVHEFLGNDCQYINSSSKFIQRYNKIIHQLLKNEG